MKVYTVRELTREIKHLLEGSFEPLWIEGEVTDFRPAPSGHLYFSLKDDYALIHCIIFEQDRFFSTIEIRNGIKIKAYGELSLYEKRGRYSLIIHKVYPSGIGELQIKFEELKRKLEKEGLFDSAHKKSIPEFVEKIGIVTAISGAAIRDVIRTIKERCPYCKIVVRGSKVQGDGAGNDIANALRDINEYGEVDVIILCRGGGSIEDLWAFNEEVVARAIYNSEIPIISGIGHEIDFTIADFVADLRASTPTGAAQIAVKDKNEILLNINSFEERIRNGLNQKIEIIKERVLVLERSYGIRRIKDLIYQKQEYLDEVEGDFEQCFARILQRNRERLDFLETRIVGISPRMTLKRGYNICYKLPDKKIVKSSEFLVKRDKVELEFYKGKTRCEVL